MIVHFAVFAATIALGLLLASHVGTAWDVVLTVAVVLWNKLAARSRSETSGEHFPTEHTLEPDPKARDPPIGL